MLPTVTLWYQRLNLDETNLSGLQLHPVADNFVTVSAGEKLDQEAPGERRTLAE
jgi:hypothetical protein